MSIIEKEAFNRLVKLPAEVSEAEIRQLEAVTKSYPYCQIAYSLLAKASAGTQQMDQTRPKAAAYALSRIALQKLVEGHTDRYDVTADVSGVENTEVEVLQTSEDILITLVEQAPTQPDKSDEQKRQQAIIESFIKKNPRISKQESNLQALEVDLSGRIADVPGSIETEAFAKILVRQGKIDKAIDIYQKLILKKPEKRNYFAKKLSELYHL